MVQRLPPLKSIEAFVVVARLRSFSKAAGELNITKSAVSRRIAALEADLGLQLFGRTGNSVKLTSAGQIYFEHTGPAFAALHQAARAVQRLENRSVLRVALPESFASTWLMPRLSRFYEVNRDIELRLDSKGYFDQLELRDADVLIRVGKDMPQAHHAERLMPISQFPVCSPTLLSGRRVETLEDIQHLTFIKLSTMMDAWDDWLALVGRPDFHPHKVLHLDTMSLVNQAALNGLGVALGIGELCEADLRLGRLQAPFAERLIGVRSLFFVCRKQDISKRSVRRFRNWLMVEAAAKAS